MYVTPKYAGTLVKTLNPMQYIDRQKTKTIHMILVTVSSSTWGTREIS